MMLFVGYAALLLFGLGMLAFERDEKCRTQAYFDDAAEEHGLRQSPRPDAAWARRWPTYGHYRQSFRIAREVRTR